MNSGTRVPGSNDDQGQFIMFLGKAPFFFGGGGVR